MSSTRILAVASLLAMSAAPAFAATAVFGQVNGNASAFLGASVTGLPGVVDSHGDAAGGLPGVLTGHGTVATALGGDTVNASQEVRGIWDNANAGSFSATGGWTIAIPDSSIAIAQATTIDQSLDDTLPAWTYAFDATGNDDLFSMTFDVATHGDSTLGLGAWSLNVLEDGQSVHFQQLSNGTASGLFTQALQSGHRYQFTLTSNDGLLVPGTSDTKRFAGFDESNFGWTITGSATAGVPEPSSWALAIIGFGMAGTTLRRRVRRALA